MRLLTALLVVLLSGCAIVPEPIQVADESSLVPYQRVSALEETNVDKPARWGGIIAAVENKPEASEVEIVQFRLNHYGKPVISEESAGRFKVLVNGFLDPVVFERGRTITFTGTLVQPVEGLIGEHTYLYPTLQGDSYHLWRKERVYDVTNMNAGFVGGWGGWGGFGLNPWFGWPGAGWYGRGFHPFWGGGFVPMNSRIRVRERAPRSSAANTIMRQSSVRTGATSSTTQIRRN